MSTEHSPRSVLGHSILPRLIKAGFTVTKFRVLGGDDGLLASLIPGGKAQVTRLQELGVRPVVPKWVPEEAYLFLDMANNRGWCPITGEVVLSAYLKPLLDPLAPPDELPGGGPPDGPNLPPNFSLEGQVLEAAIALIEGPGIVIVIQGVSSDAGNTQDRVLSFSLAGEQTELSAEMSLTQTATSAKAIIADGATTLDLSEQMTVAHGDHALAYRYTADPPRVAACVGGEPVMGYDEPNVPTPVATVEFKSKQSFKFEYVTIYNAVDKAEAELPALSVEMV